MRIPNMSLILMGLLWGINSQAQPIPDDVRSFIETRSACDHFRGEPLEPGDDAEAASRRTFLDDMMKQYCTGTDRRLRDLGRKYRHDRQVLKALRDFDNTIESGEEK